MANSKPRPLSEHERAQMRQWLETWKQASPLLEEERAARTRTLSDADAVAAALDLWHFARPDAGDNGEGLLLFSRALQKLGTR